MKSFAFLSLLLCCFAAFAQTPPIQLLTKAPVSSIRGLSAVSDDIVWVSGTEGKVGRSIDGGQNWEWFTVPGCDSCDFRDIEAFSASRAVIMAIAEPARIFVTEDGGKSWEQTYFNDMKGMFLDGMDFWDDQNGVVIGDPVDSIFTILTTKDGGNSWQPFKGPKAQPGEASFAASGTTVRMYGKDAFMMCSGGMVSRLFNFRGRSTGISVIPGTQGAPARGMFSMAFRSGKKGIVVGGDYTQMDLTDGNCLLTRDGGISWRKVQTPPRGYRSSVEYINNMVLIATGPKGTDLSYDGGLNWQALSEDGFHVVRKAKKGKRVFMAGSQGKIGMMGFDPTALPRRAI